MKRVASFAFVVAVLSLALPIQSAAAHVVLYRSHAINDCGAAVAGATAAVCAGIEAPAGGTATISWRKLRSAGAGTSTSFGLYFDSAGYSWDGAYVLCVRGHQVPSGTVRYMGNAPGAESALVNATQSLGTFGIPNAWSLTTYDANNARVSQPDYWWYADAAKDSAAGGCQRSDPGAPGTSTDVVLVPCFTFSPASPQANQQVSFNPRGCGDGSYPDDAEIRFSFDGGTTFSAWSAVVTARHTFATEASYTVRLEARRSSSPASVSAYLDTVTVGFARAV